MTCHRVAVENLAERYLEGKLDDPLRDEFEQHYFECETCLAKLQTMQAVKPVLATMAPPARSRWSRLGLAAAAAAATATVVMLSWPKPEARPVAARPPVVAPVVLAQIEPAPYSPTVYRDGAATPGPAFDAAMRLYQGRQWAAAASALDAVPGRLPIAEHFGAISHLLAGDSGAALAGLDRVIALGDRSPFEEEARYYRAQALMKLDRLADARKELQTVVERRGDYEARARALLTRF